MEKIENLLEMLTVKPSNKVPKQCKVDGIKFCVERKDGGVTTWTDIYNRPAVEILKSVMESKDWIGGRILDADIHIYGADGKWFRESLNISQLQKALKESRKHK